MTTTPPSPGRGPVPGHVAWVARRTGGRSVAPEREDRALLALVDSALELAVRRLTVADPSSGRALREHAAELAGRGVAVSSTDAFDAPPGRAHGPREIVAVGEPALRVLLAEEGSGRKELVSAVAELAAGGIRPKQVSEAAIARALGVPDVDLLVLTGGDRRVPDLLVWQVAYSEIVVLDEPWPDADERQFRAAVAEYQRRDRRYGGLMASR